MSASTKHKISGLSGLELGLALAQLRKLRASVRVEEVPAAEPDPELADQLDDMIATLQSRVRDPLVRLSLFRRVCDASRFPVARVRGCR